MEINKAIMTVINLVIVGFLLGLCITLFGTGYKTMNIVLDLANSLVYKESSTELDAYANKEFSGVQVLSALRLFEDRNYAIVIRKPDQPTGVNYGALLKTSLTSVPYTSPILTYNVQDAVFHWDLSTTGGKVIFNNDYTPAGDVNSTYNVRLTARYLAQLIQDSSGTYVGLVFTQL